ncbi:MAG: LemA family protein [Bacilli bacterium]
MGWYILIGIVVLVVLIGLFFLNTYNKLILLKNRKDDGWAQIDVELKRRADLIPGLVETVKGYAKHEEKTFEAVVKARNSFVTANSVEEEMEASNQITGALNKLFSLTESYPDLKANTNFLSLQNDLKEIETNIKLSRQLYNDSVLTYNNKVETVPSNIVANMFHFKKCPYYEVNETDRLNPKFTF